MSALLCFVLGLFIGANLGFLVFGLTCSASDRT